MKAIRSSGRQLGHAKPGASRVGASIPRFGAHMSVAGGIANAFDAALSAGCDCVQVFVKNQRQWNAPPLRQDDIDRCRQAAAESGVCPVLAHASYLINLASPDSALRQRSMRAITEEMRRCSALGISDLIVHPGAHMGDGLERGIARVARCLDGITRHVGGLGVRLLLETTAGQGTTLGHCIEELASIFDGVRDATWLGVCVDTCHVFAAGYDVTGADGYNRLMSELTKMIGLERLRCVHVNDSKGGCGGRLDRHEHIGKGKIGKKGFRQFVNDRRLVHVPMILETPKGKDGRGTDLDRVNLKRLRKLVHDSQ